MTDDEMVECSVSGCPNETEVDPNISFDEIVDDRPDSSWELTVIVEVDRTVRIDEAHCPDHSIADEIDSLARSQIRYAKNLQSTAKSVENLS